MINLREYYLQNVNQSEYYFRFYDLIKNVNTTYNIFDGESISQDYRFEVFDENEAIDKFRLLCQPGSEPYAKEDKCWFFLVSYFLNVRGYVIEQFPNILSRPPEEPSDFTYGEIRDKAFLLGLNDGNTIRYAIRRKIVSEMTFTHKNLSLDTGEALSSAIRQISVRDAKFEEMTADEKLQMVANLIENILKVNGRFIQLDYSEIMFDYIDNESIKKLRKQLQCFRHSDAGALIERDAFAEEQKSFLIDYGVTVCKALYALRTHE